jgi:2-polyprenyl-3-methyl-5-hydroxy-6-metoxy-1,4-benzoquinol methylase
MLRKMRRVGAPLELSAYPPDGMEIRLIERFVRLRGKRILEVGCGDGRLTAQLAPLASDVLAFDPDRASVEEAAWQAEAGGIRNVDFVIGSVEHLPERGRPFDVALFGWSL